MTMISSAAPIALSLMGTTHLLTYTRAFAARSCCLYAIPLPKAVTCSSVQKWRVSTRARAPSRQQHLLSALSIHLMPRLALFHRLQREHRLALGTVLSTLQRHGVSSMTLLCPCRPWSAIISSPAHAWPCRTPVVC